MKKTFKKTICMIALCLAMFTTMVGCSAKVKGGTAYFVGFKSGRFSISGGTYDGKAGDYERINDNKYYLVIPGEGEYYLTRKNKNSDWVLNKK